MALHREVLVQLLVLRLVGADRPEPSSVAELTLHGEAGAAEPTAGKTMQKQVPVLARSANGDASSEIWPLLKRPDEKYVTERAYDNPRFVEDMVRDVAARLNEDTRLDAYCVESENFESIHNHSAYALIKGVNAQP